MKSNKYILGNYLQLCNTKNTDLIYGVNDVRGVNNQKKFMTTKADLYGRDLSKFQIVYPGEFVFNHRTSRNGSKFSIAFNDGDKPIICTEDYVVFKIREDCRSILSPDWLYMFFNRSEFDRFVITNSWGSSTEFYNWRDICDVKLLIPPIEIQKKYANIYLALLTNQRCFEQGLDDIKLSYEAFYDRIKSVNLTKIDELVEINNIKNQDNRYGMDSLRGISDQNRFVDTTANVDEKALDKYFIVNNEQFAVNFMCLGNWGKFYLAYNDSGNSYLISPACSVFNIKKDVALNPYYFMCLLQRAEFQRKCVFFGDGNTRGGINNEDFKSISVPFISPREQSFIAELYLAYEERKTINEKLKAQIKDICPILIKGSIEEARKTKEA